MNTKTVQLGFYVAFLVGVSVLFYFIVAPYVAAIFLAVVTEVLFRPMHLNAVRYLKGRKNVAAFISTVSVLVIIFLPLFVIGNLLIRESTSFYLETRGDGLGVRSLELVAQNIETAIEARFPGLGFDTESFLNIGPYLEKVFTWLSGNVASFFSGILHFTLSAFLYVLCLFYLFRDGEALYKKVLAWSPLFDVYDNLILSKLSGAVTSVLRGQIMVGVVQGTLTGIGFWIFGVPHPAIWGSVAAFASLVPAIGTSFVTGPGVIFLLLTGHLPQAVGLVAWAVVAVGLVDNILGPYFINRGVKIHPFLILISVLGGISFFGPVGFIAGPVILSLLFALMEIYPIIMRAKEERM